MKQATDGGKPVKHDVHKYQHPKGPTTFDHQGPGLAAHNNHDNCGTQGPHAIPAKESGHPGIGSTSHGNAGTQGRH